eukprot:6650820-Prymnesium_polylepis.1
MQAAAQKRGEQEFGPSHWYWQPVGGRMVRRVPEARLGRTPLAAAVDTGPTRDAAGHGGGGRGSDVRLMRSGALAAAAADCAANPCIRGAVGCCAPPV